MPVIDCRVLFSSSLFFSLLLFFFSSFWVLSSLCAFVVLFGAGGLGWSRASGFWFLAVSSWASLLFLGFGFSSLLWVGLLLGGFSFFGGWRVAVFLVFSAFLVDGGWRWVGFSSFLADGGWLLGFRGGWRGDGGGLASLSHGGGGLASRLRCRAVVFVSSPPLGAASGGMVCVLWAQRMMERCVCSVAALFFFFNDHSSCGAALGPSPGGLCGVP
jgi:hypothetical protein